MPGRGRGRTKGEPSSEHDEREAAEEHGAVGGLCDLDEEESEPTLADLANLLRAHIGHQKAKEDYWTRETFKQQEKFEELQQQFRLFKRESQSQTTPSALQSTSPVRPAQPPDPGVAASPQHSQSGDPPAQSSVSYTPKLQKLSEEDDIEHFLITFERIASACRWPRTDWAFHLIPLLTGKARSAFVHMDVDLSMNYDQVKLAVLQKYDINSETYRQRFRSLQVELEETPKELYIRLKELYVKWVQPKGKTVGQINEIIILEQYLRMLSPELQVWIKEHNPKTAMEAAELADVFVAARRRNSWAFQSWKKDGRHQSPAQPVSAVGKLPVKERFGSKFQGKKPICYLCGQEGHTKPMCPQNAVKLSQMCFVPRKETPNAGTLNQLMEVSVELNGHALKALIDTGSTQTLVQRRYVSPQLVCTNETISICCVHGDKMEYPTADVYVTIKGQTYLLNAGVVDNLPFPIILGNDLPVLIDLLKSPQCNVALTRAQAKQTEEIVSDLSTLPFHNVEVFTEETKDRKSKRLRRREKFQGTVVVPSDAPDPEVLKDFKIPGNILELQHQDSGLVRYFKEAKVNKNGFAIQNDLLY
uniref:CCHC-type domain-containing protein n=1 Tax=Poecilia mexicana TaxID=48701 RepID=A0A3B3Z4U7_9TELE